MRLPDAPAGLDVWRACAGGWAECLQEGRSVWDVSSLPSRVRTERGTY